jgi:hypothetical protein
LSPGAPTDAEDEIGGDDVVAGLDADDDEPFEVDPAAVPGGVFLALELHPTRVMAPVMNMTLTTIRGRMAEP